MTKYEWKKEEKELYLPKERPSVIVIPKYKYFTIEGMGNPNSNADFQARIEALYTLSYAVRMMPRNGFTPSGYYEYTVYPLEGVWSLTEKGQKEDKLNKDELVYKIMIRQPNFVNKETIEKAFEIAEKKNPNSLIGEAKFEEIEEGLCLQMLHIGSYDDESRTFKVMQEYLDDNKYKRRIFEHKEIYISDFRKVDKDKLKTVLRYYISR